ncbi:PREDICTED: caspase-8-like [Cyprinodon variegatus]|uniref:caspase-8-like n=1 Tax=Cyprinodon variegatus TaxID=28743 RepID=UPI000742B942|nr:PREDICTED: caspase-8-like [Cyprinodon variegatus]
MSSKDIIRKNKTKLQDILCGNYKLILDKVYEKELITQRDYKNLKSINKENLSGHVTEMVDTIMDKSEKACKDFLYLLQTDQAVKETFLDLENLQLRGTRVLPAPVQTTSPDEGNMEPECKRQKKDFYKINSEPVGCCLIINNEKFPSLSVENGKLRRGTDKDAESLAKVFSWLGFRVLMCKDQTKDRMDQTLQCFASPGDAIQVQDLVIKEWSENRFTDLQQLPHHGDVFVCCILTHGAQGVVLGTDLEPLEIKEIKHFFGATDQSPLTGKPKVFLIQACQGPNMQQRVLLNDLEEDSSTSIPEAADILVALSTVEDYVSLRDEDEGSWFIQSVCEQLLEQCPGGEDIISILHHVNDQVCKKEGSIYNKKHNTYIRAKQAPELHSTLRKKLVLLPKST